MMNQVNRKPVGTKQKQKKTFKERMKNPVFLAAAVGFVYKLYTWAAVKYGLPEIPYEDVRMLADLVAYALMGGGIYSTLDNKK